MTKEIVLADPIGTLVTRSNLLTTAERIKLGLDPEHKDATLAKMAIATSKLGVEAMRQAFDDMKSAQIFSSFPLLDTSLLEEMQQVTLISNKESLVVELPLYGKAHFLQRNEIYESWASLNYAKLEYSCLNGLLSYVSMAAAVVRFATTHDQHVKLSLDRPAIPADILKTKKRAEAFGFSQLCVIWGPATYTLNKERSFKDDPLLVGTWAGQQFILDQWDVTPIEKKLAK